MTSCYPLMTCALLCFTLLACSGNTTPDEPGDGLSEEEKSMQCDAARTVAADAYAALDRSCTQDSDCTTRPVGGCGCPVPLSASAQTDAFTQRVAEARSACGEFYAGPGAQTCTNAVICDFDSLVGGEDTVVCNAQGMCDEPPTMDEESM